jgi:hypothetical protein
MDKQSSPGRADLLEAASIGRGLARSIDLEAVRAEGSRRRASRRRTHQLGVVCVVVALSLAAVAIPIMRWASTTSRLGADGLPVGSIANWVLVAPVVAGAQASESGRFDIYNRATGTETSRSIEVSALASFTWVAVGANLVGIIPHGASSAGEAVAVSMSNAKLVPLGPASTVWAGVQTGAVWLETGGPCAELTPWTPWTERPAQAPNPSTSSR